MIREKARERNRPTVEESRSMAGLFDNGGLIRLWL